MGRTLTIALAVIFAVVSAALADDVVKDGKLTRPLKIVQLQGGFAGFTGEQWTVSPDGAWTVETIFNQQRRERSKGKLSTKELAELGDLLMKADLATLPQKSGRSTAANPHSIEITFGDRTMTHISQTPPKLDAQNPNNVESRFASIWKGTVRILNEKR